MLGHIAEKTDGGGEVSVFLKVISLPMGKRLVPFEFLGIENETIDLVA